MSSWQGLLSFQPHGTGYSPVPTDVPSENVAAPRAFLSHVGTHCGFVNSPWFQIAVGLVIIANIFMIAVEDSSTRMAKGLASLEEAMLLFYLFELVCRALHFRERLVTGRCSVVAWNILDIVVVFAGVLSQWVVPLLGHADGTTLTFLQDLRALRIVRVFKIVRVFVEADLQWTEEPRFQTFIGFVIGFNSIIMGLETDIDWEGWDVIEQILLLIYTFELAARLKRYGLSFFWPGNDFTWNLLDFAIVVSSISDSWITPLTFMLKRELLHQHTTDKASAMGQLMLLMRMMRLMRILRLVKLVKSVRPLFNLVMGVLSSMQGVFWVLVLTIVTLYAVGIAATRLIGHGLLFGSSDISKLDPVIVGPFSTVPDSMFLLFRLMNGVQSVDEANAIEGIMGKLPTVKFGFVFFMITSSWTLLSILTAVVSDNMISTTKQQEEEMQLNQLELDQLEMHNKLKALFQEMDSSCDGIVQKPELNEFLLSKKTAARCREVCRCGVRDIQEVHESLDNGKGAPIDDFVQRLLKAKKEVTEQCIMKLEAQIRKVDQRQVLWEEEQGEKLVQVIRVVERLESFMVNVCQGHYRELNLMQEDQLLAPRGTRSKMPQATREDTDSTGSWSEARDSRGGTSSSSSRQASSKTTVCSSQQGSRRVSKNVSHNGPKQVQHGPERPNADLSGLCQGDGGSCMPGFTEERVELPAGETTIVEILSGGSAEPAADFGGADLEMAGPTLQSVEVVPAAPASEEHSPRHASTEVLPVDGAFERLDRHADAGVASPPGCGGGDETAGEGTEGPSAEPDGKAAIQHAEMPERPACSEAIDSAPLQPTNAGSDVNGTVPKQLVAQEMDGFPGFELEATEQLKAQWTDGFPGPFPNSPHCTTPPLPVLSPGSLRLWPENARPDFVQDNLATELETVANRPQPPTAESRVGDSGVLITML